jgi:uncharacterized protein YdeI (BOF family)
MFDDFAVDYLSNQTILIMKDDDLYYRKNGVERLVSVVPPTTTALYDFMVGSGLGGWVKRTLAETKAILGIVDVVLNPTVLFAKGTSVAFSTTETTAFEVTLPANFFASYHLDFEVMAFVLNPSTGRTLTAKFYEAGSAVITVTQAMNASDDNRFLWRGKMVKTGSNAQFAELFRDRAYGAAAAALYDDGYHASSLTEANTITVKFTLALSGSVTTGFLAGVKVLAVKNT